MVISTESVWQTIADRFETEYDAAVVYDDVGTVVHEGAVLIRANGWVELPTGRLLSPTAIHHIDTQP